MSALTDYKTKVARALVTASKTEAVRKQRINDSLYALSLPTDVTANADDVTIPEVPESATVKGLPRTSFTPEALAEFDAEALAKFREETYNQIKWLVDCRYLPEDLLTGLLTDLGLPTPAEETHVEACISGVGYVRFTLPGRVSKDDVRTGLAAQAKDKGADAVRAAFPQAGGMASPVSELSVSVRRSWPAYDGTAPAA